MGILDLELRRTGIRREDLYDLAVQCLIETICLSRVGYLIKSSAEQSEFAIYLNPALHSRSYDFDIWDSETTRPPFYNDSNCSGPLPSFHKEAVITKAHPVPTTTNRIAR